jgi:hypothetical protein
MYSTRLDLSKSKLDSSRKTFAVFPVIGCVTAMKIRLRALFHRQRAQADAVVSYANSMKGVTCDTSASEYRTRTPQQRMQVLPQGKTCRGLLSTIVT